MKTKTTSIPAQDSGNNKETLGSISSIEEENVSLKLVSEPSGSSDILFLNSAMDLNEKIRWMRQIFQVGKIFPICQILKF